MSFLNNPTGPKKEYELIPEGLHNARLIWIIDIGTHKTTFKGEDKYPHQLYLGFELVDTAMADGRPFMWGKKFTMTEGKFGPYLSKNSNLFKMLKSWKRDWDDRKCSNIGNLGGLIGSEALISISHEPGREDPTKIYAKCDYVKPAKGNVEPAVNPTILYALGDDEDILPEWAKKMLGECLERNGGVPQVPKKAETPKAVEQGSFDDDVPF